MCHTDKGYRIYTASRTWGAQHQAAVAGQHTGPHAQFKVRYTSHKAIPHIICGIILWLIYCIMSSTDLYMCLGYYLKHSSLVNCVLKVKYAEHLRHFRRETGFRLILSLGQ